MSIDKEEVKKIMVSAADSFNPAVKEDDDKIDSLINEIIMIEKAHKHTSQGGVIRKHEQISVKINKFLGYDNLNNNS